MADIQRAVDELASLTGRGTELVSVIVSADTQPYDVAN
jgi:peptide subunit release factor 1 (eRF1)